MSYDIIKIGNCNQIKGMFLICRKWLKVFLIKKCDRIYQSRNEANKPPKGIMNRKRRILDETEPLASEKRTDSHLHQDALCSNIKRQLFVTFNLSNIN